MEGSVSRKPRFQQNVGRVDHVVFFYSSFERMVDTREKMTAVLGLDPEDWQEPVTLDPPFHIVTQVNWPAGLEVICPAEGHEQDWFGAPLVAEKGEGIGMLVFGVADIDDAMERAARAGLPVVQTLQDSRRPDGPDQIQAGAPFFLGSGVESNLALIREAVLTPFNGTGLAIGQIEPLGTED
jgi:hypothetical protein